MILAIREEEYGSGPYGEIKVLSIYDVLEDEVGLIKKSKRKKQVRICRAKCQSSAIKKNKKTAKAQARVPYKKQEPTFSILDYSISDEDIKHRNSIILREAEEIWKISLALGVVFDKNKNELIEVFKNLKEKNRRRKAYEV
ncbi:hypothetical protein DITRI_Ditri12bG0020600 [Diplodiscus trichospermus]